MKYISKNYKKCSLLAFLIVNGSFQITYWNYANKYFLKVSHFLWPFYYTSELRCYVLSDESKLLYLRPSYAYNFIFCCKFTKFLFIFSRFIESSDFQANIAKKYIDQKFIFQVIFQITLFLVIFYAFTYACRRNQSFQILIN